MKPASLTAVNQLYHRGRIRSITRGRDEGMWPPQGDKPGEGDAHWGTA